jgi:hypothetical protein
MAGEMNERRIARRKLALKLRDRAIERAPVGIKHKIDGKAQIFEGRLQRLGVAHRLFQRGDIAIGIDADDERMAAFGRCGRRACSCDGKPKCHQSEQRKIGRMGLSSNELSAVLPRCLSRLPCRRHRAWDLPPRTPTLWSPRSSR